MLYHCKPTLKNNKKERKKERRKCAIFLGFAELKNANQ